MRPPANAIARWVAVKHSPVGLAGVLNGTCSVTGALPNTPRAFVVSGRNGTRVSLSSACHGPGGPSSAVSDQGEASRRCRCRRPGPLLLVRLTAHTMFDCLCRTLLQANCTSTSTLGAGDTCEPAGVPNVCGGTCDVACSSGLVCRADTKQCCAPTCTAAVTVDRGADCGKEAAR
jgi:hypothetical protein